jgi:hypothetical protein
MISIVIAAARCIIIAAWSITTMIIIAPSMVVPRMRIVINSSTHLWLIVIGIGCGIDSTAPQAYRQTE